MNIIFISKVSCGGMGAGALNWLPVYLARAGHAVSVVECLPSNINGQVVENTRTDLEVEIHHIRSDALFHHLDAIFRIARNFPPDVIYLFDRKDLYEYVYHLRHRYPFLRIVVDICALSMAEIRDELSDVEHKFNKLQHYVDHINTCDMDLLGAYIGAIFKPVTIVPFGIEVERFKQKEDRDDRGKINKFVFAGNISRTERVDVLVNNFIHFYKSVRGGVELDIYGSGDCVNDIAELIVRKSAQQYVRLKGAVPKTVL
jgi:glycosyltransferase involved in cell wall biosynthesis